MYHHFHFYKLSQNPDFGYLRRQKSNADISIDDTLLSYISDSLKWVDSYNPAKAMQSQMGLNFVGPTVIKETGARRLYKVLEAWSLLFQQSSKTLNLTGSFTNYEGEPYKAGFYEELNFDRDEVIAQFTGLANLCKEVANSHGETYIMHYGL